MMACRLPILLFAAVVMLGLGTAQAKIKVNSGDILLTDQLARTLKVRQIAWCCGAGDVVCVCASNR